MNRDASWDGRLFARRTRRRRWWRRAKRKKPKTELKHEFYLTIYIVNRNQLKKRNGQKHRGSTPSTPTATTKSSKVIVHCHSMCVDSDHQIMMKMLVFQLKNNIIFNNSSSVHALDLIFGSCTDSTCNRFDWIENKLNYSLDELELMYFSNTLPLALHWVAKVNKKDDFTLKTVCERLAREN